jgi:hypothetical protein
MRPWWHVAADLDSTGVPDATRSAFPDGLGTDNGA